MITQRVARPMLASIFVVGGLDALRKPKPKVEAAAPVIDVITEVAAPAVQKVAVGVASAADRATEQADAARNGSLFDDGPPAGAVDGLADAAAAKVHRADEAIHGMAIGGLDLDDETYVRINGAVQLGAGLLLALNRMPRLASVALAASLVPTTLAGHRFWEAEGPEKQQQQFQFFKNVGLVGGLILAATDHRGAPSLAWRLHHRRAKHHA